MQYAICSPISSYSDILAETGLQATHRLSQVLMQQSVRFPTKIIHRFICTRWHPSVKKSFNTFVAGCGHLATWENNNNMKVKTLSNTMTQHLYFHDKENIFHYTFWSSYNFIVHLYVLLYCTYYITVVLFIVPLWAKLSALPVLVLALVLVLVHVLILVLVLWLIPMQSSHLPSARAHLDRRS